MNKTTSRYQLFHFVSRPTGVTIANGPDANWRSNHRECLGAFRHYTDAYILKRTREEADPKGYYWIEDTGDMPPGC